MANGSSPCQVARQTYAAAGESARAPFPAVLLYNYTTALLTDTRLTQPTPTTTDQIFVKSLSHRIDQEKVLHNNLNFDSS